MTSRPFPSFALWGVVGALLSHATLASAQVPASDNPGTLDHMAGDQEINAAARAACSNAKRSRTLHLPAGIHRLRSPVVLPCGLTLIGDGDATIIHPEQNVDAISFAGPERVQIQNLAITYAPGAAAGTSAIRCDNQSGASPAGMTVRDVTINNADTGISINNCPFFILSANRIFSFRAEGISIANPENPDVGDGIVESNSLFNFADKGAQIGIVWRSGGGMRVMNNKFGALFGGVDVRLEARAKTSQLFVQGNSFDTMDGFGMRMVREDRIGSLSDILWNGNVCTSCRAGLMIPDDSGGPWVNNIVATGNTFIGLREPGVRAFAIASARDVLIASNTVFSNHPDAIVVAEGADVYGLIIGPMAVAGAWREPVPTERAN